MIKEMLVNAAFFFGFISEKGAAILYYGIILFFLTLVVINYLKKHRKKKYLLNCTISQIDKLSGRDFELFLYYKLKKQGYRVTLTPLSHDFGADLVVRMGRKKIVVQAKRWKDYVGIKAVQEVVGSISYYHAKGSMVITNSYFTKSAWELARANGVVLITRRGLIRMLEGCTLGELYRQYHE